MSKVTVREAALLTGKSRETINSATKDGTLSYTLNNKNHKVIDVAELSRVYEITKALEGVEQHSGVNHSQSPSETDSQKWMSRYLEMKTKADSAIEKAELLEKHHQQQRKIYEDQVQNLQDSLKLAQEGHNKATLLLENKSDDGNQWQIALKAIEERVANQENKAKEEQERAQKILRQNQALKKALEEEKNKSFWQKLFG